MVEQQNQIIACAGRKGSGKTTKARELMQRCERVFSYDTCGEHLWVPDRFTEQSDAEIYLYETPTFPSFHAGFVPEEDDETKEFSSICDTVYKMGNMLFEVEEVVMLDCSPNHAPPKFRRIFRLGRHRNIDLLYTAQRIGETPLGLRSQTDIFILFAQSEPGDLEAIQKRCGVEVAKKVEGFSGHDCLIYDVNQRREVPEVVLLSSVAPVSGTRQ